ncbi:MULTISPECIES: hypothetical protein [Ralstonia]|uniref:Copper resistance protein n=3 Tax=Ralstonia TaxID=48736 RepID=A0A848P8U4_9RALS|nr:MULTISPECIES: hypothetical protein [Ralstonia]KRP34120.1 MAG: copper resistance protein [Opitutaceae bacterium BACL24 MAG-120322-bin51]MBE3032930.1 copper resistance protein [Actinomycetota bacterium]MEA3269541.1 copper resistance protein [Pseudomonadota bacterium]NOZ14601.1 copper resistance protein [Betaproteobacteria bacterium]NPT51821.1 copper resistance protein [Ralstonia sp. 3N]
MRASLRRPWFAGFLVIAFLTVQLAAAAYACAASRGSAEVMPTMADATDAGAMVQSCPEMAMQAQQDVHQHDGLCLEHCQSGTKSANHVSPQIPIFLPVLIRMITAEPVIMADGQSVLLADVAPRAPPPPIPILNCCFRT